MKKNKWFLALLCSLSFYCTNAQSIVKASTIDYAFDTTFLISTPKDTFWQILIDANQWKPYSNGVIKSVLSRGPLDEQFNDISFNDDRPHFKQLIEALYNDNYLVQYNIFSPIIEKYPNADRDYVVQLMDSDNPSYPTKVRFKISIQGGSVDPVEKQYFIAEVVKDFFQCLSTALIK
ncbi:MAG: hypothetical protein QM528_04180 [Phycisphaerales bacterium]|nr:hypothetical protein [Phycisphaerales bacterium]